MTWLVWRQHRWDIVSALAILVAVGGAILLVTTLSSNLLSEIERACSSGAADCTNLRITYEARYGHFQTPLLAAGVTLPALIGLFIGAPLVARDLEQDTHLLVWTQGTTRRRWFIVMVALLAVGTVLEMSLLASAFAIWLAAEQPITNSWYQFDVGPVIVAYSIFAFALGIAMGSAIQRVLPAMAATLVGFIAVRVAIAVFARPTFLPPLIWEVGRTGTDDNAWLIGTQQHVDLAGHAVSDTQFTDAVAQCSPAGPSLTPPGIGPKPTGGGTFLADCLRDHGIVVIQSYQPGSRFWVFQGIEAAIFLALAIVLLAVAYWLVMRSS